MTNFESKRSRKKGLKALINFCKGNYGPDDGSLKPAKPLSFLRKTVVKSKLTEEYQNNNDIN